jgi:hypothetical protein
MTTEHHLDCTIGRDVHDQALLRLNLLVAMDINTPDRAFTTRWRSWQPLGRETAAVEGGCVCEKSGMWLLRDLFFLFQVSRPKAVAQDNQVS